MKTIIYSPYDCVVKTIKNEFFMTLNEHLIIDEDFEQIKIYPTGKKPRYSFEINIHEKDSPLYRIIEKENKMLVFLLDGIIVENVNIFNFTYNGQDSFVEISKEKITFKTISFQKIIYPPNNTKNIECGNWKHIDYVKFSDRKKSYLVAYNILTNKTKLFQGDNIQLNDNGVIVTSQNTNFHKKIVEEYFVDEQGLKSKSKVFLPKENVSPYLVPYAFLSCIKVKDFDGAYEMLSDVLKESLSPESLKSYFGNISYFYLIDSKTAFAIKNEKNIIYEFSILNGKLNEISDNN